jgi:AcrR family transcriptional regulator
VGRGEETRQRIVDTALQTIGVAGLGRMSIGELATAVGMSKSGLFAHFGSKEALELAVVQEFCRRFEAGVVEPARGEADAPAYLRALLERWMDWIDGDDSPGGCPVVMAMTPAGPTGGPARDHLLAELGRLLVEIDGRYRTAGGEDAAQFLFNLSGVLLAYNAGVRLYQDPAVRPQARRSLEDQLDRWLPAAVSGTATPA